MEEKCEMFKEANDNEVDGLGPISTKLLKHYGQNYLSNRFQEFSTCWGMLLCHETDLVEIDKIDKVPITFIFGGQDKLSDMETQKEFIYNVSAPTNVKIVKGYDHFSFIGRELDNQV